MTDLTFEATLRWHGTARDGGGTIDGNGERVPYAVPSSMGGTGKGATPEDLLVWAVASCYSATLASLLRAAHLPADAVSVRAEGVVSGFPADARFSRMIVHPTITGADKTREAAYFDTVTKARDRCFIGRTIRNNVSYEVGQVTI